MKYRDTPVKNVPSELLLFELLKRSYATLEPKTSFHGEWVIASVGIGPDHTAQIRLPVEAADQLDKMAAESQKRSLVGETFCSNPSQFAAQFVKVLEENLLSGNGREQCVSRMACDKNGVVIPDECREYCDKIPPK